MGPFEASVIAQSMEHVCDALPHLWLIRERASQQCSSSDRSRFHVSPARSRFVCTSTGALNQTIPASRVWDGVCDCCDGSDELIAWGRGGGGASGGERWATAPGSAATHACDRDGCAPLLEEAQEKASIAYQRASAGLEAQERAEEEGQRAVARWQSTLRAGEVDAEVRKQELQAVEKLEVLLKVYLQDEERKERRERAQLAAWDRCDKTATSGSERARGAAAALGACEDNTAEMEAAAKVRAARAAARARRDAGEEKEGRQQQQQPRRGKSDRGKSRRGGKGKERGGGGSGEGSAGGKKGGRTGGAGASGLGDPATAEDVLELQWSVDAGAGGDVGRGKGEDEAGGKDGGSGGGGGGDGGERRSEATMLSLKTYVKQRQAGSAGAKGGEEKVAEELRKTALLGPVLNDGERGVYLGLTVLLRMAGLPLLSPLRGLLAACGFARDLAARIAAAAAASAGLAPTSAVRVAVEGYRDRGLPGISAHLDYRRYPTLRSVVIRWDEFLEGDGRFLLVMWDAPVALWSFFFPARDDEHERPEAAMLREGIARARAILQEGKADAEKGAGKPGARGNKRQEEREAKRLSGLDLGEGARFAALAEKCFELTDRGYLYKICPFKDAKQDKHSLGRWKGWKSTPDPSRASSAAGGHRRLTMLFDGGGRCHNKKQRSCEVVVECGPEDALVAAEELEICLYRLRLEAPLACTEADLGEAARALEAFGGLPPPREGAAQLEGAGGHLSGPRGGGGGTVGEESVGDVQREEL